MRILGPAAGAELARISLAPAVHRPVTSLHAIRTSEVASAQAELCDCSERRDTKKFMSTE